MKPPCSLSAILAVLLGCWIACVGSAAPGGSGSVKSIRLRFTEDRTSSPHGYMWERKVLCEVNHSAAWAEESTLTDTTWRPLHSLPRRARVGLALGGGIVRGMAHIGVLRALEENSVPIHGIVGTSMGAIIGGLYASGYAPDSLESVVRDSIDWKSIFRDQPARRERPLWVRLRDKPREPGLDLNWSEPWLLPPKVETGAGMRVGQKFTDEIARRTLERDYRAGFDFDSLRIPFGAMLTNMKTRRSELLRDGTVSVGLRGSGAFPMAFEPIWIRNIPYIDGGVLDNLPVDAFIVFDTTRAPDNRMKVDAGDYHFVIAVYPSAMDTSPDDQEVPRLSGPLGIVVLQRAFSLAREYHVRNSWAAAQGRISVDVTGEFDFREEKFREVVARGHSAAQGQMLDIKRGIAAKEDSLRSLEPGLAALPHPRDRIKLLSSLRIESPSAESIDTREASRAIRLRPGSLVEEVDICEALLRIHNLGLYESVEAVVEEEETSLALTFLVRKKSRDSLSVVVNMDHMSAEEHGAGYEQNVRPDTSEIIVEHAINARDVVPGFRETENLVEKALVSQGFVAPRVDSVCFLPSGKDGEVKAGTLCVHGSRGRRLAGAKVELRTPGALGRTFQETTRRALRERFSQQLSPRGILKSVAYAQREFQLASVSVQGCVGDSLLITAQKKSDATLEFPSLAWEPYEGLNTYGELRLRDMLVADFAPYMNWTQNYPLKFAEELPRAQRFGFGFERCASWPSLSVPSLLSDWRFHWQTLSCPREAGSPAYYKTLNEAAFEYRVPFYFGDLAAIPSAEYSGLYLQGDDRYRRQVAAIFLLRYDRLNQIVFPGSGAKADFDAKLGAGPDSSLGFGEHLWKRARLRVLVVQPMGTLPDGLPVFGNKPLLLAMRLYGSAHSTDTPIHECYSLGGLTPTGSYQLRLRDYEDLPGYQRDEIIEPLLLKVGCTARISLWQWTMLGLRANANLVSSFFVADAVPEGDALFPMDRRARASEYAGLHIDTSLLNMGFGFKAAWPEKMVDLRGHSREHLYLWIVFYGLAI